MAKAKSKANLTGKSKTKSKVKAKTVTKKMVVKTASAKKSPAFILKKEIVPAIGQIIPNFSLKATGLKEINLKEFKNKKVVLYFYPKDATPGCTIQGHEFSKLKKEFEKLNTVVLGVSRDTVASHEKFKTKEKYTIDLLADTEEKLCNAFNVIKDKNMYGKKVRGIERSTFLVDENGVVKQEWRGVKAEGHAQMVLEYIKNS
jgi:peroxiredoxin Q/BCP